MGLVATLRSNLGRLVEYRKFRSARLPGASRLGRAKWCLAIKKQALPGWVEAFQAKFKDDLG
jgi:hypothetical protein